MSAEATNVRSHPSPNGSMVVSTQTLAANPGVGRPNLGMPMRQPIHQGRHGDEVIQQASKQEFLACPTPRQVGLPASDSPILINRRIEHGQDVVPAPRLIELEEQVEPRCHDDLSEARGLVITADDRLQNCLDRIWQSAPCVAPTSSRSLSHLKPQLNNPPSPVTISALQPPEVIEGRLAVPPAPQAELPHIGQQASEAGALLVGQRCDRSGVLPAAQHGFAQVSFQIRRSGRLATQHLKNLKLRPQSARQPSRRAHPVRQSSRCRARPVRPSH